MMCGAYWCHLASDPGYHKRGNRSSCCVPGSGKRLGSVPHNLIWTAFDYFSIPSALKTLVKAYFQYIQLCVTTAECTTAWQHLEVGIKAGCTISPLAFTLAMEIIIHASWLVVYSRGMLHLPISSLTEEYKCTKVRLEMMLLDSNDPVLAQAAPI